MTIAELHQPSKNADKATHKLLGLFLRKFGLYSLDLAVDFLGKQKVTPKQLDFFKKSAGDYIKDDSIAKSAHTTLYLNSLKDFYKIKKYFGMTNSTNKNIFTTKKSRIICKIDKGLK